MKETHKESKRNKSEVDVLDLGEGLSLLNPITEGLGFKDKVSDGVYTMQVENEDQTESSSDGGTLNIGHEEMGDGVLNIGEKGEVSVSTADVAQPALFHSGHDGLIKKTAKKSGESFSGALIDALLLLAFSIFTLAAATEISIFTFNFDSLFLGQPKELGKLLLVFSMFFLSYKIITRVFYGRTLGEWSSRHQMGLLAQQNSILYPFRVLSREVFCLLTGVFAFSILSSILRKDVGYYFSGLQTYVEQRNR